MEKYTTAEFAMDLTASSEANEKAHDQRVVQIDGIIRDRQGALTGDPVYDDILQDCRSLLASCELDEYNIKQMKSQIEKTLEMSFQKKGAYRTLRSLLMRWVPNPVEADNERGDNESDGETSPKEQQLYSGKSHGSHKTPSLEMGGLPVHGTKDDDGRKDSPSSKPDKGFDARDVS